MANGTQGHSGERLRQSTRSSPRSVRPLADGSSYSGRARDASDHHLRTVRLTGDARLEGRVVELRRESPDVAGTVVVDGVVSADDREWRDRVTVRLAPHEYETAMRAHRAAASAVVVDRLARAGNQLELTEVQLITVRQRGEGSGHA